MIADLVKALDELADVIAAMFASPRAEPSPRATLGRRLAVDLLLPLGLESCPTCGTLQAPRGDRMAVHFATLTDQRPCAGSWPRRIA